MKKTAEKYIVGKMIANYNQFYNEWKIQIRKIRSDNFENDSCT